MTSDDFKKTIAQAVSRFSGEKKTASDALAEVDRLKEKIPDLEKRISENGQELVELRTEIAQGVADGKSMSKEIELSATLRGQNEVLQDLISDLQEERIPNAEAAARQALDVYQEKISQAIAAARAEQQCRFSELVKTMAQDIIAWNAALSEFSKDSGALVSGKFSSPIHGTKTTLRFPNISAGDQPERIITLIERGEI